MAVSLSTLVASLKNELNPPGRDLYPTTTDAEWTRRLADAFWEARIHGMLKGWEVDDVSMTVVPQDGTTEITRDLLQLVVLYAAFTITTTALRTAQSSFSAQAGSVQIEVEQASNVLKSVLDSIQRRIDIVRQRISDLGMTDVTTFDAVIMHTENMRLGDEWWVR